MKIWKKFEGLQLVAEKGEKCLVTVRGPGRPETDVQVNQFGQPIRVDNGRLLEPAPTEYAEDVAATPEKAAPASKSS